MCEHKIQSSSGLTLELDQVPKVLGKLCKEWAPQSFIVSFKLETDETIVQSKAKGAIEKYGVHLVIANLLQTRRDVCFCVSPVICHNPAVVEVPSDNSSSTAHYHIATISRQATAKMIEPSLVEYVVNQHSSHYERASLLQSGAATTDTYCSWVEDSPPGGTTIFTIAAERALAVNVKEYVDMINSGVAVASPRKEAALKSVELTAAAPVTATAVPTTAAAHAVHHESHHHHEKEVVQEVSRFRKRSALKVLTLVTVVSIVSFYLGRRWR